MTYVFACCFLFVKTIGKAFIKVPFIGDDGAIRVCAAGVELCSCRSKQYGVFIATDVVDFWWLVFLDENCYVLRSCCAVIISCSIADDVGAGL